MAMNWTTLTAAKTEVGSLARWVNHDKVYDEIAEIIADAEAWMGENLRTRFMQTRLPVTLDTDASTIDLTTVTGFLDPIGVHIQGHGVVRYKHEDETEYMRAAEADGTLSAGTPSFYTIIGETMYFDVKADQAYVVILAYYGTPTPLSADNLTNIYTTRYRSAFRYVLMGNAYVFLKDEPRAAQMFSTAQGQLMVIAEFADLVRRTQEIESEVA